MKVKNCPFCGNRNVEITRLMSTYKIECKDCWASITNDESQIDLINDWSSETPEKTYALKIGYQVCPFIRKKKNEPVTCCITFEECTYMDLSQPRHIFCPLIEI